MARNEPVMVVFQSIEATYRALATRTEAFIDSYDLSPAQFEVLCALGAADGMTLKLLGSQVSVTKGTLTGVINAFEGRGLLTRGPSDSDRRSTVVQLTPAGDELYERAFTGYVEQIKRYFRTLDPSERDELSRLLMRIQVAAR